MLNQRTLIALGASQLSEHIDKLATQGEGIFQPTATSSYLLRASKEIARNQTQVLDLGCGWGFVGLELALEKKIKIYFSDLSINAVQAAESNAINLNLTYEAKYGSLFDPWTDTKFDLIICDVSGISTEVPFAARWFTGIPFAAGRDGTLLTRQVIEEAPLYLASDGKVLLPVISLSNRGRTLEKMLEVFKTVDLIETNTWSMKIGENHQQEVLATLASDGIISFNRKNDIFEFTTEIYCLSNPKLESK